MRAIIWAAVSSKSQAEEFKESIPSQIAEARQFIEAQDWHEVADPLIIPGESRSKHIFLEDIAQELPQYATLMSKARNGEIDVVICRSRDRLARSDSVLSTLESYLSHHGVQVYSLTMPTRIVDPKRYAKKKDRASVWMRGIERSKAEAEIIELQERYRMGMHGRIKKGLHPNNNLPRGYRLGDDGVGIPYEPEAEMIRAIYSSYLKGANYQELVDRFEIPGKSLIYYILSNPFYAGYVSFSRYGLEADDPPMEKGKHEAIVDEETWQATQREMQKRRGEGQRTPYTHYPVSGFVFCGYCGERMVVSSTTRPKRRYAYYICRCRNNSVRADRLEEIAAVVISEWAADSYKIREYIKEYQEDANRDARAEAASLARQLSQKKGALERWHRDYEDGLLSRSEFYQHKLRLTEELESLAMALEDVEQNLNRLDPQQIQDAVRPLTDKEWHKEPQAVKAVLRQIGFRITHKSGHVEISLAP
jgi:site-specific DNA recombinase